jgi:invasion protein IalB
LRRNRGGGQLGRNRAGGLTDMKPIIFAGLLLAAFCATPALAQQSMVGDWTIEKRSQDQHCNASRGYKDKDDENRDYAIVLTYSDKAIVMVLIYDGWGWEKVGDILKADVGTDDAGVMRKAKWEVMDKSTVRGIFEFDQSILDKLSKAKRLTIDFEDDDDDSIEMQVPRFGEALGALKFCEENKK